MVQRRSIVLQLGQLLHGVWMAFLYNCMHGSALKAGRAVHVLVVRGHELHALELVIFYY